MNQEILREITPLTGHDCFTMFAREKKGFDFPLHFHDEFELNFIRNAKGAQRIVGDHMDEIGGLELVLVGPNLPHGWFTHRCRSRSIYEVTIQFHRDFLPAALLNRNQLSFIKNMLEKASRGILFSRAAAEQYAGRIEALEKQQGFDSVLELLSILQGLSTTDLRMLSSAPAQDGAQQHTSRRIQKAMEYMHQHFDDTVSLREVAALANMTEVSFSRFFKKRTGNTFIEVLNEIRMGNASRMLIDTTHTVHEIAYQCGFNNLSNFNRTFRKKKNCTPTEYRQRFAGSRIFV
ncbi:helix-turn-helix domain-containing protein [Chitinophaga sp. GCM10012297]|uniref:Helix-turn-helix domain-containing protein n=1 Tax=Chitinophaga chungangae TaxID=2821488 RepID=A0ABS3YAR3_9BACT|nr:AraC family transcriptional regulator [Chitinophaga chungangae]MBO9151772.1 helix-turn-helix domain-containing protein [Chitinophaga chungangae]